MFLFDFFLWIWTNDVEWVFIEHFWKMNDFKSFFSFSRKKLLKASILTWSIIVIENVFLPVMWKLVKQFNLFFTQFFSEKSTLKIDLSHWFSDLTQTSFFLLKFMYASNCSIQKIYALFFYFGRRFKRKGSKLAILLTILDDQKLRLKIARAII